MDAVLLGRLWLTPNIPKFNEKWQNYASILKVQYYEVKHMQEVKQMQQFA